MKVEITCPSCKTEFEAVEWESSNCPRCGLRYQWDEMCDEDYSDCRAIPDWDYFKKIRNASKDSV